MAEYRITLKVEGMVKGGKIKVGEQVVIVAWKPVRHIPLVVGLQGHTSVPKKGALVKVFLKPITRGTDYEPILPNGFEIEKAVAETAEKKPHRGATSWSEWRKHPGLQALARISHTFRSGRGKSGMLAGCPKRYSSLSSERP
ncbi:MAG: hypothetical protein ACI8XO_004712 [Verrucomicrobiales bacterium]|jgi:hypothetical protein